MLIETETSVTKHVRNEFICQALGGGSPPSEGGKTYLVGPDRYYTLLYIIGIILSYIFGSLLYYRYYSLLYQFNNTIIGIIVLYQVLK